MASTTVLMPDLLQGTVTSSALPWAPGATTVTAAGLLAAADASNPARTCTFALEVSFDDARSFYAAGFYVWSGGVDLKSGGPIYPSITAQYTSGPPTHVRVRLDLPAVLSIGVSLDFNP